MGPLFTLTFLLAFGTVAAAQDRHNWDSLAQLKAAIRYASRLPCAVL